MTLPALNLVTLNLSRILERASEIGVRKAFGAPRRMLIGQFIIENVVLTLIGGAPASCSPSSCFRHSLISRRSSPARTSISTCASSATECSSPSFFGVFSGALSGLEDVPSRSCQCSSRRCTVIRHLLKLVWQRKRANALLIVEIFFSFFVLFAVITMALDDHSLEQAARLRLSRRLACHRQFPPETGMKKPTIHRRAGDRGDDSRASVPSADRGRGRLRRTAVQHVDLDLRPDGQRPYDRRHARHCQRRFAKVHAHADAPRPLVHADDDAAANRTRGHRRRRREFLFGRSMSSARRSSPTRIRVPDRGLSRRSASIGELSQDHENMIFHRLSLTQKQGRVGATSFSVFVPERRPTSRRRSSNGCTGSRLTTRSLQHMDQMRVL